MLNESDFTESTAPKEIKIKIKWQSRMLYKFSKQILSFQEGSRVLSSKLDNQNQDKDGNQPSICRSIAELC